LINGKPLNLSSLDHVAGNGIVHVVEEVLYPIGNENALAKIIQDPHVSILPFFVSSDKNITDALTSDSEYVERLEL
jgi:hypothetical protein